MLSMDSNVSTCFFDFRGSSEVALFWKLADVVLNLTHTRFQPMFTVIEISSQGFVFGSAHGSFLIRRQRSHPGVVLPLVVSNSAKH